MATDWGVVGVYAGAGALAGALVDRLARSVRRPTKTAVVPEAVGAADPALAVAPETGSLASGSKAPEPVAEVVDLQEAVAPLRPGSVVAAAVVSSGALALVAVRLGTTDHLAVYGALFIGLVLLSIVDLRIGLLPRRIVYTLGAVVGVGLVCASAAESSWQPSLRALIGAVAAFAVFAAIWFIYPKGMGFGDVRLAGVCGGALAWLGYRQLYLGFFAAFVIGAVVGLVFLAVRGSRRFPFGPALAAGTAFGVLWGGWLGDLWLHPR